VKDIIFAGVQDQPPFSSLPKGKENVAAAFGIEEKQGVCFYA